MNIYFLLLFLFYLVLGGYLNRKYWKKGETPLRKYTFNSMFAKKIPVVYWPNYLLATTLSLLFAFLMTVFTVTFLLIFE